MTNKTESSTKTEEKTCMACRTRFEIWHPCSDILDAILAGEVRVGSTTYNLGSA